MHQAAIRIRLGGEYAGECQFLNAVKVKMGQTDNGTGDAGHERSAGRKHDLYKSRKREYDRKKYIYSRKDERKWTRIKRN